MKKFTTTEYIQDERFRVLGVSLKRDDQPSVWIAEEKVAPLLAKLKPQIESATVLCHHAHFDLAILAWHYDIRPKFRLDTMMMARALGHKNTGLGQLAARYELGFKTALSEESSEEEVATRGTVDTELTYALFKKLCRGSPKRN